MRLGFPIGVFPKFIKLMAPVDTAVIADYYPSVGKISSVPSPRFRVFNGSGMITTV
ncbi:hypothetical protein LEP1GSC047_3760 [Leptospira inadai serovar Lyme str. 10]|uniref:Uncharacterized protein n=1 Tax=Leptospira inadai serovar Lyme str. 10 TaxID=1049790 RepID=V6HMP3_9LEPT|nr:hypothetical protein LEP1GSC047_3760 [Leptospira inadai serovar Lyme str. 10]